MPGSSSARDALSHRLRRHDQRQSLGTGGGRDGRAYDTPVVGWNASWANTLRLWAAHSVEGFDLDSFNRGDFVGAATREEVARTISRVLYPDDTTPTGKELRLKQEYFFTAASLRTSCGGSWTNMAICAACPRRWRSSSTTRIPPSPGRNWCGFCMTSTASPSTRRWRSRAVRCPTPTTRFCPRRWNAGRRTCSAVSCPATWRSWTASTTAHAKANPTRKVTIREPGRGQDGRAQLRHGPQGQRRVGAAHRVDEDHGLRGSQPPPSRPDRGRDQRRHAAPLASVLQPAPGADHHRPDRRGLGRRSGTAFEAGGACGRRHLPGRLCRGQARQQGRPRRWVRPSMA
jgi:hypothetical protein